LIVNNKVLVPVYGDSLAKLDTIALNLYKELMPDYEIIGIYSSEIIKSNGAVHCVTNTHFHENPLMIFHSYFDTAVANEAPVIDFRLNPRFKTMAASVFYKAASENEFTEVEAELENGIFSATLPVMGEDFEYYFKGSATWGGEEITVTLPEDAPTTTFSAVVIPTGINSSLAAKRGITFSQYPNPFKGKTTLTYTVNKNSTVSLVIYNVHGRKVCTLADGFHTEGFYSAVWTGTDTKGKQLSSGIYYSVLRVNGGSQNSITRKNKLYIVR